MSKFVALFGLMALTACAGTTRTERTGEERAETPRQVPANLQMDQDFIQRAASGGMYEVESSRLALSQQTPGHVTEFAQTMIRDHSQANERLEQLADSKGVELPKEMMPAQMQMIEQLRSAQGDQFTQLYEQQQQQAHRDTIALFERCAQQCQDAEVRSYAATTLPTLRQHMRHVQQMATAQPEFDQPQRNQ